MRVLRHPLVAFTLTFGLTFSASAFATTSRWSRYTVGIGSGVYSGGPGASGVYGGNQGAGYDGIRCTGTPSVNYNLYCPIPDNDTIAIYDQVGINFANANPTQINSICTTHASQTGGTCSQFNWNCGSGGVCTAWMTDMSTWNSAGNDEKYLLIQNVTQGVLVSGYVVYYESTI
jgi:hypothetical protein